jgi:subtilisin family serine protease
MNFRSDSRCFFTGLFALALLGGCGTEPLEHEANSLTQTQTEYVVVFKPGAAAAAQAKQLANTHSAHHRYGSVFPGFAAMLSPQAAASLQKNPNVDLVEPTFTVHAIGLDSSDSELPDGLDRIDAEKAHLSGVGTGARVAVVDTGIDLDHPDLAANVDHALSQTFISKGKTTNGGDDDQGHGTHVAGTIAAIKNGSGVVGVAPSATLISLKVLNNRGSGSSADIIAALDFITEHNNNAASYADMIHVANFSLGGSGSDSAGSYRTAFEAAVASGCFIAVAAGNESDDAKNHVPAAYDAVFTVSAMDPKTDAFASFSNYGADVDLTAPGVAVYSTTIGGGYGSKNGTSMATPHVAGAAALFVGKELGTLTKAAAVQAIRSALINSGESIGLAGDPDSTAEPLLDAEGLLGPATPSNAAPAVTINSPTANDQVSSGATVAFAGSAADAEDGDVSASLTWTSSIDGAIGSGASFSAVLSDGVHTITATATDSKGKVGQATISLTVGTTQTGSTSTVSSVSYSLSGPKGRDLNITVSVVDDRGAPVGNATVSIKLSRDGQLAGTGAALTDASGTVTFLLRRASNGTYATEVTDVAAAGLTWDGATPANSFTK